MSEGLEAAYYVMGMMLMANTLMLADVRDGEFLVPYKTLFTADGEMKIL